MGIDDATAQLEARYVNDSRFMGNQVGNNGLVGPYMPFGVLLFHCQAGNYEANYHWECTVGGQYDDCDYTRFIGNRWETNQREGAKFFNSSQLTIDGNHVHTNSMQLSGTYAGITFDTCSASNITSNLVYTWNATLMSYSMVVSNDCQDMVIDGNRFAGYATEPVSFNIGSVNIKLTNNQPPQNRISQSDGTWLQIASSIGAITAGNTRYLGSNGSSPNDGEVGFVVPRPCTATGLRVNHTVAPGASAPYPFTLRKNLADTSFVITSNGGSQFGASGVGSINFNAGDLLSVKVVASAGAATATMIGSVVLDG